MTGMNQNQLHELTILRAQLTVLSNTVNRLISEAIEAPEQKE